MADQFAETELSLDNGEYTFAVTANEDGLLSLVVVGEFGDMSDDSDKPGELYNGGIYIEEEVASTRYATLTIPELESPQEVLVYIAAGEEGGVSAYLSGEDAYASIDTVDTNLLRFWTQGGEYSLEITPTGDATTLQVIPFLSGPVSALALGEDMAGTLSDEKDTAAYQFEVSQAGLLVTVAMTSDVEDSDFELSVGTQPGAVLGLATALAPKKRSNLLPQWPAFTMWSFRVAAAVANLPCWPKKVIWPQSWRWMT